jgi:shikimate kinase
MSTYIVAIHNNSVFLLALGLPFDRALPWHKLMAFAAIFNSLVHAMSFYFNGRAKTMPDAYTEHHIITRLTKAYGMEVTGVFPDMAASQFQQQRS